MTRRHCAPASWRPLVLAAALTMVSGADSATAQTVMVKGAPAGSNVEVVLNAATVGTAAAVPGGYTTVAMPPSADAKADPKAAIDAFIFVDTCDSRLRVLIVERGAQAAALEASCIRREIAGLFLVRPVSTLVVDVTGPSPTLLLRQRKFNPGAGPRTWSPSPLGLVVFGGGSYTWFSKTGDLACGNVDRCIQDDSGGGYTFGAAYWILPFVAAEATYVKPGDTYASGTGAAAGTLYSFNSALDAEVLTVSGIAGYPAGPVRVYGKFGAAYHRATFTTTESVGDSTITVGGVTQTIPGGTQTLAYRTSGWGWMLGGGLEVWLNRTIAAYGEFGWGPIKGKDMDGGEAVMDEKLTQILFGAKVHIGR